MDPHSDANDMNPTTAKTLLALLPLMLTGCVSTSTLMVNDSGQSAHCDEQGWGWIGAPMALSMHQDCMQKYQAAGFHEAPAGTTAPAGYGAQTFKSTDPTSPYNKIVPSKDGSFKITLPPGWVQVPPPDESYFQLAARDTLSYNYLLISDVNTADVSDWQLFSAKMKEKVISTLTDAKASETSTIKVNGYDALRADISGTLKNGLKVHYLATVLKTDKKLVYVLSWTKESNFDSAKSEMEHFPWTVDFS